MKQVTIRPVLNGFVVEVGCQTVVFSTKKALLSELSDYIDKPMETEQRYLKEAVNQTMAVPEPTCGTDAAAFHEAANQLRRQH